MVLTKVITRTGSNGSYTGTISIEFEYRSEPVIVNMPGRHVDTKSLQWFHRVKGKVDDSSEPALVSEDFIHANDVWKIVDQMETKIAAKLLTLANVPREKTLVDQLKEQGFK